MGLLKTIGDTVGFGNIFNAGAQILGGVMSDRSTANQNAQNVAYQKEFAQKGVQWKVEDAKKAGLHPLYALGANTTSFSPVPVTGSATGDAIARGASNVVKSMSQAKMNKLQTDLVEAQIQESRSRSIAALAQAKATNAEADFVTKQAIESAHRRDTQIKVNGIPIDKDPDWSDTQDVEDRIGDVGGAIYGLGVLGADVVNTTVNRARAFHNKMEDIAKKKGLIYVRNNNERGQGMWKYQIFTKDWKLIDQDKARQLVERWNR
jgi:hypothetical protein